MTEHIYPVFDNIMKKEDKELLLKQQGKVIWFTGLSGSGKTTLAKWLERNLHERGFLVQILDGDNIRTGINNNLGFSESDRFENIRRIAEVTKLFINAGIITLNSFITPTEEIRERVRQIVGEENIIDVWVNPPLEECERRDTKGLYKKARAGEIKNFTGISSPFDPPKNPALELDTQKLSIEECVEKMLEVVLPKIKFEK